MVKGNSAIPKVHQRKHWNPSSCQKGNVKTFLAQPKKAETRRRRRIQKAKKAFPRPLKALRPTVACPTVRYNFRKRLGRGFTVEEIRAAGISPRYAATIGIRVDLRRKNISEQSLKLNTDRLKTYLSKLVLFPLNKKKIVKGEASPAEQKTVVRDLSRTTKAASNPKGAKAAPAAPRKVDAKAAEKSAYKFLKTNLSAARFLGERVMRAKKKEEKAKAAAEKKSK
jgi:large subunit ribosomal protein L13e